MTNSREHQAGVLQDRFALKITARLTAGTAELPYDISERLRAARVQALASRKVLSVRTASSVVASGAAAALTFGDEGLNWWSRIASALPLLALVAGLVAVTIVQNEDRANEVAEVDAALLTDDLPPAAYADPGFVQFIKSGHDQSQ